MTRLLFPLAPSEPIHHMQSHKLEHPQIQGPMVPRPARPQSPSEAPEQGATAFPESLMVLMVADPLSLLGFE